MLQKEFHFKTKNRLCYEFYIIWDTEYILNIAINVKESYESWAVGNDFLIKYP